MNTTEETKPTEEEQKPAREYTFQFEVGLTDLLLGTLVLLIIAKLCCGCTVTRVGSGEGATRSSVTSYTVAWPWLDTTKALDKAKLGAKTNASEIALSGYSETENMSTNAALFMERGVGAAVSAAVKAAK